MHNNILVKIQVATHQHNSKTKQQRGGGGGEYACSCHNPEANNMKQIQYTKQLDNLHNNSLSHSFSLP